LLEGTEGVDLLPVLDEASIAYAVDVDACDCHDAVAGGHADVGA
jgi:hypothetical protein